MPDYKKQALEAQQIVTEQNHIVVKSNDLIRQSRYSLSTTEQKVLLYLVSKIQPADDEFKLYSFTIKELCKICGIECQGDNYTHFRDAIKQLADKSFWIQEGKNSHLVRWCERVSITDTTVTMRFDDRLRPYLLLLNANFTQYGLSCVLAMKSKHSMRLFELLKSYSFMGECKLDLDYLKKYLDVDKKYDVFNNFKVRVLDVAIAEINQYSDVTVNYVTVRASRKITAIHFTITEKTSGERLDAMLARNRKINPPIKPEGDRNYDD